MFYVVNLDVRQSRRANDSASIVKRAKERFHNSQSSRKRSRRRYFDNRGGISIFDNRGIWPPAALSLVFAIAKSFFGVLYHTSAIIISA